ncbi:Os07g0455100 [Oryza sativa Japonica Group]|uniref:Os07g0455100 protein n=1 Tax=Oryza sativa subsp. japonica TaxID=39947 RepID=Q0D6Q1_ORYSJ|nr:Os07g0455100 [Oryza sativa Japonica Group]|eukprot:NP_001059558.2 Os07g0455100 [Oryza sativa Japonica Group]
MAASPAPPGPTFLREVELRLLRCTLPSPATLPPPPSPPPRHPLAPVAASAVAAVDAGDYAAALASAAPHLLPPTAPAAPGSAARFYGDLAAAAEGFLRGDDGGAAAAGEGFECRCAVVLSAAVAAILAFTQQNVTGPPGKYSPFPFWTSSLDEGCYSNLEDEWDAWASAQLASIGSHVHGKFSLMQCNGWFNRVKHSGFMVFCILRIIMFIVFAELMLTSIKSLDPTDCCSVSWWLCRLSMVRQNIVDELSSTLFDQVQEYKNKTLAHFGELENVFSYWGPLLCDGEGSYFVSAAFLEAGIAEYKYGRIDQSSYMILIVCHMHGLEMGELNFGRQPDEVDAKSQMVLVANTSGPASGEGQVTELTGTQDDAAALKNARSSVPGESDEFCDILRMPRLVENDNDSGNDEKKDPSKKAVLTAMQQAAVLAECLHVSRRSRHDEMSGWEMAPFIESIDSQEDSYFVVRSLCDILRIRWESTRNRTKQRALLMMENMVEDVGNDFPVAAQRAKLVFGVQMPTIPALRKEYGELLISCGIVGEALDIFKDLELWDNLIYCYRLLGKVADATSLINARISVTPNDPRLWCSLGDVTNNDDHYKKALEVSNNKSARALRSLARSAYNRNDFHASKMLWESALALNSLFPDGWFAYGTVAWKTFSCKHFFKDLSSFTSFHSASTWMVIGYLDAVKIDKDLEKAVDAFTRSVQIDPENGEAWNNIACLLLSRHMIRGRSQAAVQAFKEAVKFKRNSWEVWDNYSKVLLDTGSIQQTLEAVKMVLNLSSNKRFNIDLLEKVMAMLEEQPTHLSDTQEAESSRSTSDDANQETRKYNQLLDIIGDILQQIVRSGGSNSEIWGLYARWHKTKGNLIACSEAMLKQVRSLQGSGLWHDQTKFTKYAQASLQLCKIYMEISSSTGSQRELFSAEMHLKSSLKQHALWCPLWHTLIPKPCLVFLSPWSAYFEFEKDNRGHVA